MQWQKQEEAKIKRGREVELRRRERRGERKGGQVRNERGRKGIGQVGEIHALLVFFFFLF